MRRKLITVIMALAMIGTLLGGCSKKGGDSGASAPASGSAKSFNGVDVSQPVTLRLYLLGEKSKDFDAVYAEINKILKEKVNATVEVSFLTWAEHDQKYSLLFSGGEDFDLIFTAATWAHYETTAAMGGFHPLSKDFLQQYAPDILAVVPQVAWDQAEINGTIYMVPNYQNEFKSDVYALRGDLLKKYGYNGIADMNQLMEFFDKVAADQRSTSISPRGNIQGGMIYEYLQVTDYAVMPGTPKELFIYHTQDPSDNTVTYLLDWDLFEQYCQDMKTAFDKGFWSQDSLASSDERQDGLLRGTSASMAWNLGSCTRYAKEANKAHPEWECTLIDFSPKTPKVVASYINNGMAINAASKKKERAMMVLNEFYTNKVINNMASFGIEGVHWTAVGDKEYQTNDRTGDYGIDSNCNWAWSNMTIDRTEYIATPTAVDTKNEEIMADWNNNIKPAHALDGFAFDQANVSSELAMVDSIIAQYYTPLLSGMAGNVPAAIAELRRQLGNAGIQKIYDEFRKQADAYVKSMQ
jgi:putative aldouronate transport system substrate-binding protein